MPGRKQTSTVAEEEEEEEEEEMEPEPFPPNFGRGVRPDESLKNTILKFETGHLIV